MCKTKEITQSETQSGEAVVNRWRDVKDGSPSINRTIVFQGSIAALGYYDGENFIISYAGKIIKHVRWWYYYKEPPSS